MHPICTCSCLFTPLSEGRSARDLTQAAPSQKKKNSRLQVGLPPQRSQVPRLQLPSSWTCHWAYRQKISSSQIAVAFLILNGLQPKKSQAVRLQLLPCSLLAGSAATKKFQARRVQLLSCSFLTGPATKKSKVVRLQLLPCSPLARPAATKISSSQIAVATLQLPCWTCRPKNLKQSHCENHARKMRTFFTRRLEPKTKSSNAFKWSLRPKRK